MEDRCPACGSGAGERDGICVVCGCPQPRRQIAHAPERVKALDGIPVKTVLPAKKDIFTHGDEMPGSLS